VCLSVTEGKNLVLDVFSFQNGPYTPENPWFARIMKWHDFARSTLFLVTTLSWARLLTVIFVVFLMGLNYDLPSVSRL